MIKVDIHKEKEIQIQSKAFTRDIEEMNDVFMAREEKMLELRRVLAIKSGNAIGTLFSTATNFLDALQILRFLIHDVEDYACYNKTFLRMSNITTANRKG